MVDTRALNGYCKGCGRQGHFLFAIRADEILPNCPAFAKVPAAIRDGIKLAAAQMIARRRARPRQAALLARQACSPSKVRSTS